MRSWNGAVFVSFVAAMAGCNPQPTQSIAGALSATESVRKLGVDQYVVDGRGADLYQAGSRVGRLEITVPSEDTRSIVVALDDGRSYTAFVEGKHENGFRVAVTDDIPVQAFQTDPALASLFETFAMSFPLATNVQPAGDVSPAGYDVCAAPPNLTCRLYGCTITNHSWSNISRINSAGAACPAGTKIMPSESGIVCNSGVSNQIGCYCGVESFVSTVEASCQPVAQTCINAGQCDRVLRVRTCSDPGGACTTPGSGASGCTTQTPTSGVCYAGTAFALSVGLSGSGTVTSDDGVINCGGTCSGSELSGNVVVLTATPAAGYAFQGWGGACSGNSQTCTVTMNAAKSVTATFANMQCSGISCPSGSSLFILSDIGVYSTFYARGGRATSGPTVCSISGSSYYGMCSTNMYSYCGSPANYIPWPYYNACP